jgi:DNA-directed RNA polymerase subunit alpha
METTSAPSPSLGGATTDFMAKNWRDLIRPRTLDIEERSDTYGKFSCEPLERGFGTTLGVALRRVLLSSLQGASITHIAIEGALHEFTSLPGVIEDVTDIILNLKETLFKVESDKTYTVRLDKQGEGVVTASDLTLVDGVTVLNPNHRPELTTHRAAPCCRMSCRSVLRGAGRMCCQL